MNQPLTTGSFDYTTLDTDTQAFVQARTAEIHTIARRTAEQIVAIGKALTEVKDRLAQGQFGAWLEAEFQWTDRTARNFMRVYDTFKLGQKRFTCSPPHPPQSLFEST